MAVFDDAMLAEMKARGVQRISFACALQLEASDEARWSAQADGYVGVGRSIEEAFRGLVESQAAGRSEVVHGEACACAGCRLYRGVIHVEVTTQAGEPPDAA